MIGDRAQLIKIAIMQELSKEGKTLDDLEQALTNDLEKTAGPSWFISPEKIPEAFKGLFNIFGGSAVAGGMLAGTGAYGAYLQNEDSTNKQLKKMKEIQQYHDATNTLKANMQNPLTL